MTQKQIEQTRVIAVYDGWELRGEPEFIQPYKIWIKQLSTGTKMIPYISPSGKEYDGWHNDMKYLTSLDWLHKVALDVMDRVDAIKHIEYSYTYTQSILKAFRSRPINGEYSDLVDAVYEAIVYLKQHEPCQPK